MDDRELLELAAKAAGHEVKNAGWTGKFLCLLIDETNEDGERMHLTWNPLTDDGDALRLLVRLKLWTHSNMGVFLDDPDPYAATRRAIVCAAAEIGKKM